MNNYCFVCIRDERKVTVISEAEVQMTMSHFSVPLCPKHFTQAYQEKMAKKGLKQKKQLHDALEDYPELQRLVEGGR